MAASETSSSSESEDHRRNRRDGRKSRRRGDADLDARNSREKPRSGGADSRDLRRDERKHRDYGRSSSGDEGSDSDGGAKRRSLADDRRQRRHANEGEKARNHRSDGRGRGRDEDGEDGGDDRVRERDRRRRSDTEEIFRSRERTRDEGRRRSRDEDSPCRRDKKRDRDRDRRKQHSDEDRSPRRRERTTDNGRDQSGNDDDRGARRRRHRDRDMDEGHPRVGEPKKVENELPPPPPPPMPDSITGRTGGIYIPPFRMAQMMREVQDKSSEAYQRLSWDALRKSINGLVNKVNATNIKNIIPELFSENLIRGRGLFCRSCMKSQMASPGFTDVFAALVAVVNSKFPEVGLLLMKRIVLQLKRAYKRNDKVAVGFVKECGALLQDFSPQGLHGIFERFRGILHEGEIDKRVQFLIEGLFAIRKAKFQGFPAIRPELDLVEQEDQFTHEISLEDEIDPETNLDVFKPNPKFLDDEKAYENIKKSILGMESSEDEEASDAASDDEDEEESEEEEEEKMEIKDETETNLVNLRRTIYLTIMSSVDFEEAGHKLLKIKLEPGQEVNNKIFIPLAVVYIDC
ncbi:putative pre-mRNA-splicing factor CWC22 [Cocos nucifera]|uniref:Putative pre-mRNA-splicing factor CWC22 n=1 Tax=Cocos nucifera TaxID=13894 RepID=A0A8K0I5T9_COCNU|nr:putative pre-mRNA-splicing factor CWC22 [Cocos nucifera]